MSELTEIDKKSYKNYTFFNQTIYLITASSFNLVLVLLYIYIYIHIFFPFTLLQELICSNSLINTI